MMHRRSKTTSRGTSGIYLLTMRAEYTSFREGVDISDLPWDFENAGVSIELLLEEPSNRANVSGASSSDSCQGKKNNQS